jgi:hypothetical protein
VARLKQVPVVLTEDAVHGRVLEGIRFLDPFSAACDVTMLESPR